MTCSHFQEQMLVYFGQKQLPTDLQEHLAECTTCQAAWKELSNLGDRLGENDLFHPNDAQVDRLVSKISSTIEEMEQDKKHYVPWVRRVWHTYVPTAAAAALVLGIAIGKYMTGGTAPDSRVTEMAASKTDISGLYEEGDQELDEDAVITLIDDFTTQHSSDASEWLLDDLTEEELKYLEKSFDVGDLL